MVLTGAAAAGVSMPSMPAHIDGRCAEQVVRTGLSWGTGALRLRNSLEGGKGLARLVTLARNAGNHAAGSIVLVQCMRQLCDGHERGAVAANATHPGGAPRRACGAGTSP